MPKVNVYLPEPLYEEVRRHELPVSAIAQDALAAALAEITNHAWIESARRRRPRATTTIDTAAVLDEVRDEFGW